MAIFGINFNDFGSRKLRIDSQKKDVSFSGGFDNQKLIKYAVPSQPAQIPPENPVLPTIKYGIPSDFKPHVIIPPKPTKPPKPIIPPINVLPTVKYGIPPKS